MKTKEKFVNWLIKKLKCDTNKISDGYHTFEELYNHRIKLYMCLCKEISESTETARHHRNARGLDSSQIVNRIWRSKKHSDGSAWAGWFILGINSENGRQITYHLPEKLWHDCDFAQEYQMAPEFDGHTSNDVLRRLDRL